MNRAAKFTQLISLVVLVGVAQRTSAQTVTIDLGTLGGNYSWAVALNENGQVAGTSYTVVNDKTTVHAFFWTASSGMVDVGTLGGRYSESTGINNAGQVVGW